MGRYLLIEGKDEKKTMDKYENNNCSPQELFWGGGFGDEYTIRNAGAGLLGAKVSLFSRALIHTRGIKTVLEIGSNRGLNLRALNELIPGLNMEAVEINASAAEECSKIDNVKVFCGSAFEYDYKEKQFDLSFTAGVLIHVAPERLLDMYNILYTTSRKYIIICEYYSPQPVSINYRGNDGFLFKRDYAGEMLDYYPDLELIDYGFVYHRDNLFPLDDLTWFLLEKGK